jgi:hypothetical protein
MPLHNRLHRSALLYLTALSALVSTGASPAAAQSVVETGSFTVSQLGHQVGTAQFRIARASSGYDSTSTVRVSMQGLE